LTNFKIFEIDKKIWQTTLKKGKILDIFLKKVKKFVQIIFEKK
jgi:hypothetical protein